MKFNERLLELRNASGKSQKECAEEMGISNSKYNKWENGVNSPDYETLCFLARFYSTTTDYLLGMTDNKTNDTNVKAICDYTGLSEFVVLELHERNIKNSDDHEPIMQLFINSLANSVEWFLIELNIMTLLSYSNKVNGIDSGYKKLLPHEVVELEQEINKRSYGLCAMQPIHEQIERTHSQIMEQLESLLDKITGFNKIKEDAEQKWDYLLRQFRHIDPLSTGDKNNG